MNLKQYDLEPDYSNLFKVAGQDSKEIILAVQYVNSTLELGTIGQMYNNGDGGWSSIVPTQNLVDTYEMADGLTKEESGSYAPKTIRLPVAIHVRATTIIYPGMD